MKRKVMLLLLSLSLLCTMLLPGTTAYAANDDSGMVIRKSATSNEDGTYTIQLEAYATGSKVITEVTEDVPTDIILVLDQSGSMSQPIGAMTFKAYDSNSSTNSDHYNRRHNGGSANLYYPLGDGSYASVSVTTQEQITYSQITNGRNNPDRNQYTNYWTNRENLYAKVNGEYLQITVKRTNQNGTYTYTLPDGTVIGSATGRNNTPNFTSIDEGYLYLASVDANATVYTYTYTDAGGDIKTIGTSTGATTIFDTTLYESVVDTSVTRLAALQTAVTTFSKSVAAKAAGADGQLGTEDDVNHRIAVVGFATGDYSNNDNYPTYENTELFIGSTQYNYNSNASNYYGSAFQDMNTQEGQTNVIASKNALAARGATYTNCGLEMANGIFAANPLQDGEKRNRVVIIFTDGEPGYTSYDSTVASSAIAEATTAKNTYGATVYTVGIFSGADASSAGDANGRTDTEKANWFMQNVSSNNGTPQNPSYYLSAADSATLNNIFQQISDQIESGGSSTTLGSDTVIKDMIAPAFTLPADAEADDITLETWSCTGKEDGAYTWQKNSDAMGAEATVDGDQVSVTGFDFAANYVGTVTAADGQVTYRGDKLVIKFKVSPKEDFLGGNGVYTNGDESGIYSDDKPVLYFDRPTVDVPVQEISPENKEQEIYLGTAAALKELITTDSRIDGTNNAYVDITYTILDGEKPVGTYTIPKGETSGTWSWESDYDDGAVFLESDKAYTLQCKVAAGKNNQSVEIGTGTVKVKTCSLTIQKSGCDAVDAGQSFLFTITGTGNSYAENVNLTVSVQGNGSVQIVHLPVGTYTIQEQSGWSWRYTPGAENPMIELKGHTQEDTKTVTIQNTRLYALWLDGNANAVNSFTGKN